MTELAPATIRAAQAGERAARHQRPLQELADAEGVPVGTVKSRLHRARALLVARLMPVLSGEGSDRANAR